MDIQTQLPEWAHRLASFDVETTGLNVATSRIVSAGLSLIDHTGAVVETRYWLVDPGIEIPTFATQVHGITTEQVRREGLPAERAVPEITAALNSYFAENIPVVIYNAPYDLGILFHESRRYSGDDLNDPAPIIDPLILDKQFDRYRKGKRNLGTTAEFYKVPLENAHDASADALAAARVALALATRFATELNVDAYQLHQQQQVWAKEQALSYQEWVRANRDPNFTASGKWPM